MEFQLVAIALTYFLYRWFGGIRDKGLDKTKKGGLPKCQNLKDT